MNRAAKSQAKALYEMLKDIRVRMETGKPTTFKERNVYYMEMKKQAKRKKEREAALASIQI
jgi:hypothetical protein